MKRALLLLLAAACAHAQRPLSPIEASVDQPLHVSSVRAEYDFVKKQRCADGGPYRVTGQALVSHDGGCYVDKLEVECRTRSPADREAFYFQGCD